MASFATFGGVQVADRGSVEFLYHPSAFISHSDIIDLIDTEASVVQILSLTQKLSATRHIAKVSSLIIYRIK
jgi:hypothetical protein